MITNLTRRLALDDGQGGGGGTSNPGVSQTAQTLWGGDGSQTEQQTTGEGENGGGQQIDESTQTTQTQGGQQQQTQLAAGQTLSLEAIKQLAAELRGTQAPVQQQQVQQQPQMTEEEFNKLFNVYRPDVGLLTALRSENPEEALTALNNAFQSVVRQASTVAAFHTLQEVQKMQQMLQPVMQFTERQQLDQMKNEFFQQYPNLKGMEPLLLQIRDSLIQQGRKFDKKEDAFKAVAEKAQEILTKIQGFNGGASQQNAGQGGNPKPGQQTQQRRMPTLSGKGQAGGGQGGSNTPKSTAERIFGPR